MKRWWIRGSLILLLALEASGGLAQPLEEKESLPPELSLVRVEFKKLVEQGDFAAALGLYRNFVEQHPQQFDAVSQALIEMARAYERMGAGTRQVKEAIQGLEGVEHLVREYLGATMLGAPVFAEIGDVYLRLGQYERARDAYQQALEFQKDNTWWIGWIANKMGNAFLLEGSLLEAQTQYETVLQLQPVDQIHLARARIGIWRIYGRRHRWEEAESTFKGAVGLLSLIPPAQRVSLAEDLAAELRQAGEGALEPPPTLLKTLAHIPEECQEFQARVWLAMGRQFLKDGRYQEAEWAFYQATAFSGDRECAGEAWLRLGYIAEHRGNRATALIRMGKAARSSNREVAQEALQFIQRAAPKVLKPLAAAIEEGDKASLDRVESTLQRIGEAREFERGMEYEEALELWIEAAREWKSTELGADALVQVARLHHMLGEYDDALEVSQQVLELYPDQREICAAALLWQAYSFAHKEDSENAIRTYTTIIQDYADCPRLVAIARGDILYQTLLKQAKPLEAIEEMKQAMAVLPPEDPAGVEFRLRIARLYLYGLRQPKQALAELQKLKEATLTLSTLPYFDPRVEMLKLATRCLMDLHRTGEAVRSLEAAVERYKEDAEVV